MTTIWTVIILYCILLSVPVFFCAFRGLPFEKRLSIGPIGIIIILFLTGIFHNMKTGFYICVILSCGMLIASAAYVVKNKRIKKFFKNFFNYAFYSFSAVYCLFILTLYGMSIHIGDEYSHWGAVVIYMSIFDRFGTAASASLEYGNYVPGMSLFQYFCIKLNQVFSGTNVINDWLMYFAYHILVLCFTIPMTCGLIDVLSDRKRMIRIGGIVCTVLMPLIFFKGGVINYYGLLQVDAALAIIFGCGLAAVLINDRLFFEKPDLHLYIVSCSVALCLIKQSGILMSFFLLLIQYVINGKKTDVKQKYKEFIGIFLVATVRIIWRLHCDLSGGAFKNSNPIRGSDIVSMLFHDDSVKRLFFAAFFDINAGGEYEGGMRPYYIIGDSNVKISYHTLFVIFIMVIILLFHHLKELDREFATRFKIILLFLSGFVAMWEIGTLAAYEFEFNEYCRERLDSFFRYKNTLFLSILIFEIAAGVAALSKTRNIGIRRRFGIIMVSFFLINIPGSEVNRWLSRDLVRESIEFNEWHEEDVDREGKREIYDKYMKILNETKGVSP